MRSGVRISPSAPLISNEIKHSQGIPAKANELEGVFVSSDSVPNSAKKAKVGKKVGKSDGFLSVAQAAELLDISERTARNWCESGKLPAITKPYGAKVSYHISPATIELFLAQAHLEGRALDVKATKPSRPHSEYVVPWLTVIAKGLMTGKPFSPHTQAGYKRCIDGYFERHGRLSIEGLKREMVSIPASQYSKRRWLYEAVVCFAKFLISEEALKPEFLVSVKAIRPKRHLPPKRHTVNQEQLTALVKACKTVIDRALVLLLASTGLRASEACALKVGDIDLQERILTVRLGKGNKSRRVGLGNAAYEALSLYMAERQGTPEAYLFRDIKRQRLDRSGLYQRLERIGKAAGVQVSPHALRRAFVTINANAGRPLQMLQLACGHGDIKTTMGYCRTGEAEVIAAMRDW